VDAEDYETRYNLGIAYREMGLQNEAIAEFQYTVRSPEFFLESCAMLGLCFREKELFDLAEEWYKRGIEADNCPEESRLGLLFDMAEMFEQADRKEEALKIFKEIYKENAGYRDVGDHIDALRSAPA